MDAIDAITANNFIRMLTRITDELKERKRFDQDFDPMSVRGEGGWEINMRPMDDGIYKFSTFDPVPAQDQGIRDFTVYGMLSVACGAGAFTSYEAGAIDMPVRFAIYTDFPHMVPIMKFLLETFDGMMGFPIAGVPRSDS